MLTPSSSAKQVGAHGEATHVGLTSLQEGAAPVTEVTSRKVECQSGAKEAGGLSARHRQLHQAEVAVAVGAAAICCGSQASVAGPGWLHWERAAASAGLKSPAVSVVQQQMELATVIKATRDARACSASQARWGDHASGADNLQPAAPLFSPLRTVFFEIYRLHRRERAQGLKELLTCFGRPAGRRTPRSRAHWSLQSVIRAVPAAAA